MATKVSQMTQYRREHPEFYAEEKAKNSVRFKTMYDTNEEFRNRMLEHSRRYYADPEKRARKAEQRKLREQRKKLQLSVN